MKRIKKPKVKLTKKQKKFLVEYFKTGNATRSAMKAYNCRTYSIAGSIGCENLKKLENPVRVLMEANGLDMGKLMNVLKDGLNANRVISAMNTDKQATGATADFIDVPDHAIRHKYLETASKWLGVEKSGPETAVQVNVFNRIKEDDSSFVE